MTFSSRILLPSDAEQMRDVRLESLDYYGAMFECFKRKEADRPIDYWKDQCTEKPDHCWFGAFADQKLIGLQGIRIWGESTPEKPTALWWGNYVKPEYRGQGAMKPLYMARLNWAKDHDCDHAVGYVLGGKERPLSILLSLGAKHMFTREMSHGGGPAVPWHWYKIPLSAIGHT